jgi:cell division septum initiation protein DivIVA
VQLASKAFLDDLAKTYQSPLTDKHVQKKLLKELQRWAEALRGEPSLVAIPVLYQQLAARKRYPSGG